MDALQAIEKEDVKTDLVAHAENVIDFDENPAGFNKTFPIALPWLNGSIQVTVTTEGWEAAGEDFRKNNVKPLPPSHWETATDPHIYKALGQSRPCAVKAVDPTDEAYKAALKEYSGDFNRYVCAACIVTPMRSKGKILEDVAEKASLLKSAGITDAMAAEITALIIREQRVRKEDLTNFSGSD